MAGRGSSPSLLTSGIILPHASGVDEQRGSKMASFCTHWSIIGKYPYLDQRKTLLIPLGYDSSVFDMAMLMFTIHIHSGLDLLGMSITPYMEETTQRRQGWFWLLVSQGLAYVHTVPVLGQHVMVMEASLPCGFVDRKEEGRPRLP